ncbi:hypothetical protein WG902_04770 [Ramlibacter sp. PS3R-8]|uniref:hypothetical protein n=1 Tax=Ramlibacter sp. PS3R-8 TaxID=3133437 RepID=UPI0030A721FA
MAIPELPADVRRFILTSIPSVPYLEAALLLRAEPQQAWTDSLLAQRLYVPERTAAELLAQLRQAGVVTAADGSSVRFAPLPELAVLLDRLAAVYTAHLMTVTNLIHSRLERRAHQFADAFRFRKDKE